MGAEAEIIEALTEDAGGSEEANQLFAALWQELLKTHPPEDLKVITKAYQLGAAWHKGQTRKSGEAYITHPLEVAVIAAGLRLDLSSVVAAVLHDTVEDTECTLEDIENEFGEDVRSLVDGLTKISKIKFRSTQERLAENFRKMVIAMANDLRVILIKLCDRLHNLRTLGHLPEAKRKRISQESLDIYAPLANRLGIYGIKSEMEDLCFRQLKSDIYQDIKKKVAAKKAERQAYIEEVRDVLENEMKKYGFKNLLVYGRPKHFYSIYKKMTERGIEFDDIHDLFAFRIVVESVKDCYEALGIVHAMWKPMPGRFKDYIAMPKANLYQSLHTTVIRPNGEPAEIQIRTHDMHETCEYGVAAHWDYKEAQASPRKPGHDDSKKFSWLRQIMEWQTEIEDPEEFLEAVKVDLFEEEIFVFTPKGDVIQLASKATALDFAFQVHTAVGLTTVGAKVNGKLVPLKTKLDSGDIVEILTSKNQTPGRDWLNWVTTSKARNKIRSHLRTEQRERSRKLGKELFVQELSKFGMDYEKMHKSRELESVAKFAKESNIEDVFVSLGYGRIQAADLFEKAFPKLKVKREDTPSIPQQKPLSSKKSKHGILVHGIENVLVNFGRCCGPLPGEEIIGFITRGRGVTVHRSTCARALDMDPHRKVEVHWANEAESKQGQHDAFLRITTRDKTGVLAEVTNVISSCGANIKKAQIRVDKNLMGVLDFELGVKSMAQMTAIIGKLECLNEVVRVDRLASKNS